MMCGFHFGISSALFDEAAIGDAGLEEAASVVFDRGIF